MRLFILTEAGKNIGLGHLSRCSALYEEAISRGIETQLLLHGDYIDNGIFSEIKINYVNWMQVDFLIDLLNSNDYVVVDSYLANLEVLSTISSISKKVLFFDDYDRLDYPEGVVVSPKNMEYDFNNFSIIRKDLRKPSKQAVNPIIKNVIIMLGGTDHKAIGDEIAISLCKQHQGIHFYLMGKTSLKVPKPHNLTLIGGMNAKDYADLLQRIDFGVIQSSQSSLELIQQRIPFISIKNARNQEYIADFLRTLKIEVIDYNNIDEIQYSFMNHLDFNKRKKLFDNMLRYDFNGQKKCIDLVMK